LTPEDVVKRIAAEFTYIDERGAVGIPLERAAAIVPQYEEQSRARRRQRRASIGETAGVCCEGQRGAGRCRTAVKVKVPCNRRSEKSRRFS
jgi:hypothetical protein